MSGILKPVWTEGNRTLCFAVLSSAPVCCEFVTVWFPLSQGESQSEGSLAQSGVGKVFVFPVVLPSLQLRSGASE